MYFRYNIEILLNPIESYHNPKEILKKAKGILQKSFGILCSRKKDHACEIFVLRIPTGMDGRRLSLEPIQKEWLQSLDAIK